MNKFDPTKPVQTRDGRKARIICTDYKGSIQPVIAIIDEGDRESVHWYNKDGRFLTIAQETRDDLINVPEKRKVWVNINSSGSTYGYQCREVADEMADSRRIACKELEYYEGEGLEGEKGTL